MGIQVTSHLPVLIFVVRRLLAAFFCWTHLELGCLPSPPNLGVLRLDWTHSIEPAGSLYSRSLQAHLNFRSNSVFLKRERVNGTGNFSLRSSSSAVRERFLAIAGGEYAAGEEH